MKKGKMPTTPAAATASGGGTSGSSSSPDIMDFGNDPEVAKKVMSNFKKEAQRERMEEQIYGIKDFYSTTFHPYMELYRSQYPMLDMSPPNVMQYNNYHHLPCSPSSSPIQSHHCSKVR
jgi:hypothetical protein